MGSLLLDSREGTRRGGGSGAPAVVRGKPEESLLVTAVRGNNREPRMPPGKPLDQPDVDALVKWIMTGAPDPGTEAAPAVALAQPAYHWDKVKKHWAYQPVKDTPRR